MLRLDSRFLLRFTLSHCPQSLAVQFGEGAVVLDDDFLGPYNQLNNTVEIKHHIDNQSDKQMRIIEVQFGGYLFEDDIVRFEESYGRVGHECDISAP